jgi:hypothetical protein
MLVTLLAPPRTKPLRTLVEDGKFQTAPFTSIPFHIKTDYDLE